MIQAVAMHENRLLISKSQPVSQPVGKRSQSSGLFLVDGQLCGPDQQKCGPEGTGRLTWQAARALSLPTGLDSVSHQDQGWWKHRTRVRAFSGTGRRGGSQRDLPNHHERNIKTTDE